MDHQHWQRIADRLEAAWSSSTLGRDRRNLYYEVLRDLPGDTVARAVEELIRQDREQLPGAGVIRAQALHTGGGPVLGGIEDPCAPSPGRESSAGRAPSLRAPEIGVGAGLALACLGVLLPWARAFVFEISGIETPDGRIFGAGLLVCAGVFLATLLGGLDRSSGGILLAIFGAIFLAGALGELALFQREVEGTVAQVGVGLYVLATGAAVWAVSAVGLAVASRHELPASPGAAGAIELASGRPSGVGAPDRPSAATSTRRRMPRRRALWGAGSGAGALAGVSLLALGAVAVGRPASRCAAAVAEVDAAGNRIPGAYRCLDVVATNEPLNAQIAPALLGGGAALFVAGCAVLTAMLLPGGRRVDRAVRASA